tara:strand:- start:689 stop:1105 length:417 start_codon:yes stop_codon:yes gene_type:complete
MLITQIKNLFEKMNNLQIIGEGKYNDNANDFIVFKHTVVTDKVFLISYKKDVDGLNILIDCNNGVFQTECYLQKTYKDTEGAELLIHLEKDLIGLNICTEFPSMIHVEIDYINSFFGHLYEIADIKEPFPRAGYSIYN